MLGFLVRRILGGILTLYVIATFCFFIVRFAPGNPFSAERQLPPEVMRNLEAKYHYDKPVLVQYALRMKGYLVGDFGPSIKYQDRQVEDIIFPSLATSIQLGALSFAIAMTFGLAFGLVAAARHNRLPDYLSMSVALLGICVPNFLLGPILVMILALALGWLPVAGWPENWSLPELSKLVLPAFTLALVHVAYVSRLGRAGMLDVLHKDYIRTARAKGLSEASVVLKHALKNGVTPVLSYAGPMAALIFTGSLVVEKIFNIPGMGQHFVDSAFARDLPMIMGTMLVYSTLIIAFNVVVDIGYSILDPRVRLS
jgi:oligopeptide transport system permease protein